MRKRSEVKNPIEQHGVGTMDAAVQAPTMQEALGGPTPPPHTGVRHVFHGSVGDPCDDERCNICQGGLQYCIVCNEGEGGLAKICPGDSHAKKPSPPGPYTMAPEVDAPLFVSMNKAKDGPVLSDGFAAIVTTMQLTDVKGAFDKLVKELKLGIEARNDKGRLREALDNAEDNARLAHLLYSNALVEKARYEIDAEPVFGQMWADAVERLEEEAEEAEEEAEKIKAKTGRKPPKKNITDTDTRSKAAAMRPDQWRRHHVGLEQVKAMVGHMKALAECWEQRCRTLNTLLSTGR